jgi:hypothetical protein
VREIRTLRAMRRGLETAYGAASEALPKETGSQRLGCTYGDQRQSSTLPAVLPEITAQVLCAIVYDLY